jgi:hypothetical protein
MSECVTEKAKKDFAKAMFKRAFAKTEKVPAFQLIQFVCCVPGTAHVLKVSQVYQ